MRKKELRTRNDQLRWEITQAKVVAAQHAKQINEHRMELAIIKVERELRSVEALEEARDAEVAPEAGQPCPTCGQPAVAAAPADPAMKSCPECAEAVRVSARKCRYCDYRFDGSKDTGPNGSAQVARLGSATGA